MKNLTVEYVEKNITVTRESYSLFQEACKGGTVSFDDYLQNITDAINDNSGTIEGADIITSILLLSQLPNNK